MSMLNLKLSILHLNLPGSASHPCIPAAAAATAPSLTEQGLEGETESIKCLASDSVIPLPRITFVLKQDWQGEFILCAKPR